MKIISDIVEKFRKQDPMVRYENKLIDWGYTGDRLLRELASMEEEVKSMVRRLMDKGYSVEDAREVTFVSLNLKRMSHKKFSALLDKPRETSLGRSLRIAKEKLMENGYSKEHAESIVSIIVCGKRFPFTSFEVLLDNYGAEKFINEIYAKEPADC